MKFVAKLLKPDYRKVIVFYLIFVLLYSVSDWFYWCYENSSSCKFFVLKYVENLLNPLHIISAFGSPLKEGDIGGALWVLFLLLSSYLISSIIFFIKDWRNKKFKRKK